MYKKRGGKYKGKKRKSRFGVRESDFDWNSDWKNMYPPDWDDINDETETQNLWNIQSDDLKKNYWIEYFTEQAVDIELPLNDPRRKNYKIYSEALRRNERILTKKLENPFQVRIGIDRGITEDAACGRRK